MATRRPARLELPPGSHRDLLDLLNALHQRTRVGTDGKAWSMRQLSGRMQRLDRVTSLSPSYINQVLNGRRLPRPQAAFKLAEALGASTEERAAVLRYAESAVESASYARQRGSPRGRSDAPGRPSAMIAVPSGRVWNIRPPVRGFTGRQQELAALGRRFEHGKRAALTPALALHGMGGIGKTQLARAYAYAHRGRYHIGWWVPSETPLEIATALGDLAVHLGASGTLPPAQLLSYLHQALADLDEWLLIFDNATGPAELEPFLPAADSRGHVLITSRNPAWQHLTDPVEVDVLPPGDAIRLLYTRTRDDDESASRELAEELGWLPLAIQQAAAYIADQRLRLSDYLVLFRRRRAELLARGQPLAYQSTVAATVTLILDHLEATSPAALRLLELCSLLASGMLPIQQLLTAYRFPDPLGASARDPITRQETVAALFRTGLLTSDDDDTVRVHRLVQAVVSNQLPDRGQRLLDLVEILASLFPPDPGDPDAWPVCTRLLPHALAVIAHAEESGVESDRASLLLGRLAEYLRVRGQFSQARTLLRRARLLIEKLHGPRHAEMGDILSLLGLVLSRLGEPSEAKATLEQALAIHETSYGRQSVAVAQDLDNLGLVLRLLRDLPGSRACHEQALGIRSARRDIDEDAVAMTLTLLANTLRRLGQLDAAREASGRALAIHERLHGASHPQVAADLGVIGLVERDAGELERARAALERAMLINLRVFGPNHPTNATSLRRLGTVQRQLGQLEAARANLERALRIYETFYGPDHPDLKNGLLAMGLLLRDMGELPAAAAMLERAREISERTYGAEHPDVATSLRRLGSVQRRLGLLTEAEVTIRRALRIFEAVYGSNHQEVAHALLSLGLVLRDGGSGGHAEEVLARSSSIYVATLGPGHMRTRRALERLAEVRAAAGDRGIDGGRGGR